MKGDDTMSTNPKTKETKTCPDCHGARVVPGRYTEATELPCATCGGTGEVPADKEQAQEVEDAGTAKPPRVDADA